jgi:hypothetical protein
MSDFRLNNWVPYKLTTNDGQIQCCWLNTYGEPFIEPFFDETILKCRGIGSSHAGMSSVSNFMMINEWGKGIDAVIPTAFIFHVSRCGSTLVSQLLATADENIVLAEVPFFDDVLRLPYKHPDLDEAFIAALFADTLKYYGQKRSGKESRLFIKADSWHLFFYRQLRSLYPAVPFIIMYRRPDEVFRSHHKQPGMQAVNSLIEPQLFGFNPEDVVNMSPEIYLANVIESYFSKCLEIVTADDQTLLLNYSEGPMPMIERIAAFTKTTLSRQDILNMTERSVYHSKKPGEIFSEKQDNQTPASLAKAIELYNMLEERRKASL